MIPVQKNHEYTIEIASVADDGNGVGRIDGYTVFVPGTVTGDTAIILIVKVKASYGYGKLIKILTPSKYRVEPICKTFSKCGGCSFMHIDYQYQLELKKEFICNNIKKIGKIQEFYFDKMLGMENPYAYRNKMIFPIGTTHNGDTCFGFYAKKSHRVVELDTCHIGEDICSTITADIVGFLTKNHISHYDEEKHSGLVRRVFLRTSRLTSEIMVIIVINGDSVPCENDLVSILIQKHPRISSIIINSNKERTNLVLGKTNRTIFGNDFITDEICGNKFKVSPHSFFQVNPYQTEKLYNTCIEYANISKTDTVMDIYCGTGTISLLAAKLAKKVIGIEIVNEAIFDANRSAKENNITNAEFYAGSADKIVPYILKSGEKPDIVILDPPRKGCDEITLSAIVESAPKRISYVSCNPSTLARDINFLCERGYNLEKVSGVDMFPHTTHVECCVLLCRT